MCCGCLCTMDLIGEGRPNRKFNEVFSGMDILLRFHETTSYKLFRLSRFDLVITTYGTVMTEMKNVMKDSKAKEKLEDLRPADEDSNHNSTLSCQGDSPLLQYHEVSVSP